MGLIRGLYEYGKSLPPKAPPVPLLINGLGQVGHAEHSRGLYVNSSLRRHLKMLLREQAALDRLAIELAGGRFSSDALVAIARRGSDSTDAIRLLKSMRGALTSYNGILGARASAKAWDVKFRKENGSNSLAAETWASTISMPGAPGAVTFTNIPGGARLTSASAGALPLPMTLGGAESLYLSASSGLHTLQGSSHPRSGLVVDVLVNAGNISATSTTTQTVNSTSLSRWTDGAGVQMTLVVTTLLGGTASNVTINYTNQAGTAGHVTTAAAMLVNANQHTLQPTRLPAAALVSGDYGVRSVENVLFSASMGAGVLALLLYKPVALMAGIQIFGASQTNAAWEYTSSDRIGGIRELVPAGGEKPFLGMFVAAHSGNAPAIYSLFEFVWG